ncbi:MAG: hypothetical protein M1389_14385 [Chloroflexi bacterium]|nr:hypothetical protein [Chloroflexota bacterium]
MNLREFLVRNATTTGLVACLRGESLTEIAFKTYCVGALLSAFKGGEMVSAEQLVDLAEDFEAPLSEPRILQLLSETGLIIDLGGRSYQVASSLSIGKLFPRELRGYQLDVALEAIKGAWPSSHAGEAVRESPLTTEECLASIERTWSWALEIISYCIDHALPGVPVFWPCEDGQHRPLGQGVGTMSTADTLLLLLEPVRFGLSNSAYHSCLKAPVLLSYLEMVLGMQCTDSAWYRGAFTVQGSDDDFVGSSNPAYDTSPPPTVDATADVLLMLGFVLRSPILDPRSDSQVAHLRDRTMSAVRYAAEFLLRSQLEMGAWGIHRYETEGDRFRVRPRELSCKYTVEALGEVTRAGLVDAELRARSLPQVEHYLRWAKSTAVQSGEEAHWLREFVIRDSSDEQRFYSTVWVAHSLLAVTKAWPELRAEAEDVLGKAMAYILRRWSPNRASFAAVELDVASWRGMEHSAFPWELPGDPMVVSLVLDFFTDRSVPMQPELRQRVDRAIRNFLGEERHGHWVDFLMKREGTDRAMPSNTYFYNVALLSYLRYLYRGLQSAFDEA